MSMLEKIIDLWFGSYPLWSNILFVSLIFIFKNHDKYLYRWFIALFIINNVMLVGIIYF